MQLWMLAAPLMMIKICSESFDAVLDAGSHTPDINFFQKAWMQLWMLAATLLIINICSESLDAAVDAGSHTADGWQPDVDHLQD